MTEAIVVALIAAIGSVIGQALISRKAQREEDIKRAVLNERTSLRLDAIERKLDIHNGYAEKFGEIQIEIAEIRKDMQHFHKEEI